MPIAERDIYKHARKTCLKNNFVVNSRFFTGPAPMPPLVETCRVGPFITS